MGGRFQRPLAGVALAVATLPAVAFAQTAVETPLQDRPPISHPAVTTLPVWIMPPLPTFPNRPPEQRYTGEVQVELTCTSQPTGEVTDCIATHEEPQGLDLGLGMTPTSITLEAMRSARMAPRTVDGTPEASVFRTVVRFGSNPDTLSVGAPVPPAPEGEGQLIQAPRWGRLPTTTYPERAMIQDIQSGQVTLNCGFLSNGDLVDCRIISELPTDAGFGSSALIGARRGRVSDEIAQTAPKGSRVQFTLRYLVG